VVPACILRPRRTDTNAADTRQCKGKTCFFNDYIRHLPEASPEVLGKPGVSHVVFFRDERCRIEADMNWLQEAAGSVEDGPSETWAASSFRSAKALFVLR
jgi:hypothetical protein